MPTTVANAAFLFTTNRRNGDQMMAMVTDVPDISTIEAGKLTVEKMAFAPWQCFVEVEERFGAQAAANGIEFELTSDGPLHH